MSASKAFARLFVVGFLAVLVIYGAAQMIQTAATSPAPTLNAPDLTATALCIVLPGRTGAGQMLSEAYSLTATPNPVRASFARALRDAGIDQGKAERGRDVFYGTGSCHVCHSVTPGEESPLGTNLFGIAYWGGSRQPNVSAQDYIIQSILLPDEYVVPGMPAGIMPRTYGQKMTNLDLGDLVAYLLTLV
jgi:mono/diheme cytochrome c family protein